LETETRSEESREGEEVTPPRVRAIYSEPWETGTYARIIFESREEVIEFVRRTYPKTLVVRDQAGNTIPVSTRYLAESLGISV
jgi:hypothetical protein